MGQKPGGGIEGIDQRGFLNRMGLHTPVRIAVQILRRCDRYNSALIVALFQLGIEAGEEGHAVIVPDKILPGVFPVQENRQQAVTLAGTGNVSL